MSHSPSAQLKKYPALSIETMRLQHRSDARVLSSDYAAACARAEVSPKSQGATRSGAHCAEGAGLVPYKTSLETSLCVSFSPSLVAERRVNRLKKSVWASGHLHGFAEVGVPSKCWFVTLTYASANAWCPKHISKAVQGYRNWCASRGVLCRYTWVAEIQPKRLERTGDAVVHYHLLAWLPEGVTMPHWDRETRKRGGLRAAFWPHGMTNTEKAFSGVGYLMKYLSKLGELTIFPAGLRLYGIGGLTALGASVRRWFNLPAWVKQFAGVGDSIKVGNAHVLRESGEILETPYVCKKTQFGVEIKSIRPIPARWFDGVYSSVSFGGGALCAA